MKAALSKSLLMTALITGSVMNFGSAAFAEDVQGLQEFTLDPMVVTAQRMEIMIWIPRQLLMLSQKNALKTVVLVLPLKYCVMHQVLCLAHKVLTVRHQVL